MHPSIYVSIPSLYLVLAPILEERKYKAILSCEHSTQLDLTRPTYPHLSHLQQWDHDDDDEHEHEHDDNESDV
jgi:hypothetical protein